MKVDNFRAVRLDFTEKMVFPKGAADSIKEQANESQRRLKAGGGSGGSSGKSPPVQVAVVKARADPEEVDGESPILEDFEVMSLDGDGINISLRFNRPYNVSAGDEPDLLLLQIDLGDYKS